MGCETAARVVVERMDGVRKAEFWWEEARGVVTYDTTRTSIDAVIEELHRLTGYEARVEGERDGSRGPPDQHTETDHDGP